MNFKGKTVIVPGQASDVPKKPVLLIYAFLMLAGIGIGGWFGTFHAVMAAVVITALLAVFIFRYPQWGDS